MELFIKNMLCSRCVMVVKLEMEQLGFHYTKIEIGRIECVETLNSQQLEKLRIVLSICGLELINNKRQILIEKIKNVIFDMVNYSNAQINLNFSDYLRTKLGHDYTYMANTFSELEGVTIAQYVIINKIRRAKELIAYNEKNLTEISWELKYSSVAHLSMQFKKVTGQTPSHFKNSTVQ